jgi:hypothetical protein
MYLILSPQERLSAWLGSILNINDPRKILDVINIFFPDSSTNLINFCTPQALQHWPNKLACFKPLLSNLNLIRQPSATSTVATSRTEPIVTVATPEATVTVTKAALVLLQELQ